MEWTLERTEHFEQDLADADHPLVRQIVAPRRSSARPLDRIDASWQVASADTIGKWSGVAYHFSRALQHELDVPVGIINCSWGGTPISSWTTAEGYAAVPELRETYVDLMRRDPGSTLYREAADEHLDAVAAWVERSRRAVDERQLIEPTPAFPEYFQPYANHKSPAMLHRGMVHAFVPYTLRGTLWYQGENNHREGMLYFDKTRALLAGWRKAWDREDLPFYFVQLAPFNYGRGKEPHHVLAEFREVQSRIDRELPHTGMAVINDLGDAEDIHPRNKRDVGQRLAGLALNETYGQSDRVTRSPVATDFVVDADKLTVEFDRVGQGLRTRDGQTPDWFEIAGEARPWTPAEAKIIGPHQIQLSAAGVERPVAVRFAWDRLASPNLVNSAGLPTSAFRLGTPPDLGVLAINVPGADEYRLVYALDLHRLGATVTYDTDRGVDVPAFDRVAYLLELTRTGQEPQWVFVSMDAFTDDPKLIGIPTVESVLSFSSRSRT